MRYLLKAHLQNLWHWTYPYYCYFCRLPSNNRTLCCDVCSSQLPWVTEQQTSPQQPFGWDSLHAALYYRDVMPEVIKAAKFCESIEAATLLGHLLLRSLQKQHTNVNKNSIVIATPLHKKRLQERGYNQALLIAKPVAQALALPINTTLCHRAKPTLAQAQLNAKARQSNMKKAFRASPNIAERHIIVIDDVVTTGHTAREITQCLKHAGAASVRIWCCCAGRMRGH